MKTKTNTRIPLIPFFFLIVLLLSSCEDDNEKSPAANGPVKKEADVKKVLAFREELNFVNRFVTENVINMPESEGGRISFRRSIVSRLKESAPCAVPAEEEQPDGSLKITLDFGDGCQTEEGIEVAGKVVMIFRFTETAFEYELEFINYSELSGENQGELVNGTVKGSMTLQLDALVTEMEQHLTITYADKTEAGYKMAQRSEMTETGLRIVALTTSGNFANGGEFTMTLRKALVYDFNCEGDLPVSGEELLTFQGNTILVNYGNGSCDNRYSVK